MKYCYFGIGIIVLLSGFLIINKCFVNKGNGSENKYEQYVVKPNFQAWLYDGSFASNADESDGIGKATVTGCFNDFVNFNFDELAVYQLTEKQIAQTLRWLSIMTEHTIFHLDNAVFLSSPEYGDITIVSDSGHCISISFYYSDLCTKNKDSLYILLEIRIFKRNDLHSKTFYQQPFEDTYLYKTVKAIPHEELKQFRQRLDLSTAQKIFVKETTDFKNLYQNMSEVIN